LFYQQAQPKEIEMTAKTTVTHADGTVSTRTSKTRTYSHAIEISPAPADHYAAYLTALADECETAAARYRTAAENRRVQIQSRGFRDDTGYFSHQATLLDTDNRIYTWCSQDGKTEDILTDGRPLVGVADFLARYAVEQAASKDEQAAKYRAEAAEVLATGQPVGSYSVLRWSSRADLAIKAISEFEHYSKCGHQLRVVAVD
jgi:hypothetical protein